MSILVQDATAPTLTVSNLFASAQGYPVTLCLFAKVSGWGSSGFFESEIARIGDASNNISLRTRRNGTSRTWRASVRVGGSDDSIFGTELGAEAEDNWMPFVFVLNSATSRTLYTRFDDGTLIQDSDTSSASPSGIVAFSLFPGTVGEGPMRIAHVGVYQAAPNATQVEQYMDTGSITGLTPYSMWRATTDWGGGDITDEGSSGTDITPVAGMTFSSDNPALGTAGITSKTLQRNGVNVAASTTRLYVYSGHNVNLASATADFGNASIALTSGVFANVDLSSTGIAIGGNITVVALPASGGPGIVIETTAEDIS